MKSSIIIILFFCAGIVMGMLHYIPENVPLDTISFVALCALMLCVGVGVGSDETMWRRFRTLNPRLALLPLFTVFGSLAGCLVAWLFLPHHSLGGVLAAGSGFGYYSLSSVIITDACGAELGTIALLSNILREIITLIFAPLLARCFGTLAPIASGGATTADTTLPVIVRCSGTDFTVLSVYHGCAVDFCVPFLVTFFCSFAV